MSKYYLYAAAVQGIQDFIFKTNELRHIVGASELVDQVCTSAFEGFAKGGTSVVRAAGNIKHVFTDVDACKKAFREFPRKVMRMAPGVTVSQAVQGYDKESQFGDAVDAVEAMLKVQRNKPQKSVLAGLMGIKRANNTGLPVTDNEGGKKEYFDDATWAKLNVGNPTAGLCKKSFDPDNLKGRQVPYDISEITGANNWIAVVHADGNGVGKVVQKVGKNEADFKKFSERLDEATQNAARKAYNQVKVHFAEKACIPIRPVVLNGDDMTVIIRGDLAVEYAKVFMEAFQDATQSYLGDLLRKYGVFADGKDFLTACAGIAFIKSSYPFYYGYQLAEELCAHAKRDAKSRIKDDELPPSCLMFHKVQDSFITDYEALIKKELTVKGGMALFKAGPYYLSQSKFSLSPAADKFTVDALEEMGKKLDSEDSNGLKSGIRNWITLRLRDKEQADQRLERMRQMFSDTKEDIDTLNELTSEDDGTCLAYDALAYYTIMNQTTNNN